MRADCAPPLTHRTLHGERPVGAPDASTRTPDQIGLTPKTNRDRLPIRIVCLDPVTLELVEGLPIEPLADESTETMDRPASSEEEERLLFAKTAGFGEPMAGTLTVTAQHLTLESNSEPELEVDENTVVRHLLSGRPEAAIQLVRYLEYDTTEIGRLYTFCSLALGNEGQKAAFRKLLENGFGMGLADDAEAQDRLETSVRVVSEWARGELDRHEAAEPSSLRNNQQAERAASQKLAEPDDSPTIEPKLSRKEEKALSNYDRLQHIVRIARVLISETTDHREIAHYPDYGRVARLYRSNPAKFFAYLIVTQEQLQAMHLQDRMSVDA